MNDETGCLTSEFAEVLNALDEMHQSMAYVIRRSVLRQAERVIVQLEKECVALRLEVESFRLERDAAKEGTTDGLSP